MRWAVAIGVEFEAELLELDAEIQIEVFALSRLLQQFGPELGRPRVDTLNGSRHANMKELRFSAAGGVWRVAFAFDPTRRAILLVAGDKSGGGEKRFDSQLERLRTGEEIDMAKNVEELIRALPPEVREMVEARSAALVSEELTLQELRRARKLTQVRMAKEMGISQDSVSRLEKRTDLLLSTLRKTVEAMGGQLRLVAEFPDRAPVVLAGIFEEDHKTGRGRRKGPVPKRVA